MDEKTAMLACHKSQQQWLDTSQGLNSYLETMRDLMREVGRMSGRFEYAEGWRRHMHLGLCARRRRSAWREALAKTSVYQPRNARSRAAVPARSA